ncbi:MAG: VOC family protein [Faecalibacterium sp.]|nr:VOC family protein [Faecalibacterium sp.]
MLHAAVVIDHVTIYCKTLPLLTDAFARLGFVTADGKHYMFRKNYLEGYAPGEGEAYDFFPGPAGLHSFIFWADDPDASYQALVDAGYEMAMPVTDFARPAIVDGKAYTAAFRGAYLKTPLFPLGETALVRQVTPQLVYLPGGDIHPNGVDSMEEFYLCVPDADKAQAARDELERASELIRGQWPVHDCVNKVSIAADWQTEFGVKTDPARSCVCGIRFSCRDFAQVKAAVEASGYPFHPKGDGLVVDLAAELNLFLYFEP